MSISVLTDNKSIGSSERKEGDQTETVLLGVFGEVTSFTHYYQIIFTPESF
jgi:hypothetical protein